MDGKTARGASSPANPALTRPEPLSHTRAVVSSSSHMFGVFGMAFYKRREWEGFINSQLLSDNADIETWTLFAFLIKFLLYFVRLCIHIYCVL